MIVLYHQQTNFNL